MHLIPAFLWVKSAFRYGGVLGAAPLRELGAHQLAPGGTRGGTVLYIVYYIYEHLSICFPVGAFLAFVISLSPFSSAFCLQDESLHRQELSFVSLLRRLKCPG